MQIGHQLLGATSITRAVGHSTYFLLKTIEDEMINGIDGRALAIGNVLIQDPFKYLDVVIDVLLIVIEQYILTLLSGKNMQDNNFDIFVQGRYES